MNIFALLLGGGLGFLVGIWWRYRLKSRLVMLLRALPDTPQVARSLSMISLVRRELTYLKEQGEQYRQERDQWQEILEQAPWGYLQVDKDNNVLGCNRQARKWLYIERWQPGQLRLLLELVRSSELDQLIERTRQTQTPHVQEWLFFPPLSPEPAVQGPYPPPHLAYNAWLLKGYSYPLPRQQVVVFIENLQSLAELRRGQDRLFADLTHELRTPLTAISLVAEALHGRLHPPEQLWVGQMLDETERLRTLVDEWLDLSQMTDNPCQYLDLEDLDLRDVLLSSWQRLLPLAQKKQVQIDYQGPGQLWLHGDRDRLTQVFINLFDNCLKHSPEGGLISVQVKSDHQEPKAMAEIKIIDQGQGFHPQDLPYIFERLYRGDSARTRPNSHRTGSGLGLAIAKEIVEAHNGTLQACNAPPPKGACLTVILPLPSACGPTA